MKREAIKLTFHVSRFMARRQRRKRRQQIEARLSPFGLLAAALVVAFLGGLVRAFSGFDAALITAAFWFSAMLVAFLAGIYYYAQFLLPPDSSEAAPEGFQLLQRFFLGRLRGQTNLPGGVPQSFEAMGAGIIPSHQALAIARNHAFIRATQPGFVRLYSGETITGVIDLRPQRRERTVEAITRDGIPLSLALSIAFQVKLAPDNPDRSIPYPVDHETVFRLAYAGSVDGDADVIPWHERVCRQLASEFVSEIARSTLGELFPASGGNVLDDIRHQIQDDAGRRLRPLFGHHHPSDCPVDKVAVTIDRLQLPPEIHEQALAFLAEAPGNLLMNSGESAHDGPNE